jgi:hypothetical protein
VNLTAAIEKFRALHPEWETQLGALYQCVYASQAFMEFLQLEKVEHCCIPGEEIGVYQFCVRSEDRLRGNKDNPNPDPSTFILGSNEAGYRRADWHCIVETPIGFIDWTARQYTDKVPYPYIIPKPLPRRPEIRLRFNA